MKAVEELNELATALLHYRLSKVSAVEVAKEVTDVEIMCAQMRIMLGKELCKEAKREKLARLARRLEDDVASVTSANGPLVFLHTEGS